MNAYPGRLILLSGEFDAGKTTLLLMLQDELKSSGLKVTGVISPPILKDGEKVGIGLQDLASATTRQLAVLRARAGDSAISTKRWSFLPEGMADANRFLADATPCDVLIIDELGPLEFEGQAGWTNGLAAIDSRQYALAICVVRPSLIEIARSRWPQAQVIEVTRSTQADILAALKNLAMGLDSPARLGSTPTP